jgi:mono/diheme cytochrome c family protein
VAVAADVAAGEDHYGKFCARCHGIETVSSNIVPDLRRSPVLSDPGAWQQIVIGGALTDHGMVGWSGFLTPAQAETIRRYVGEKARTLQKSE